MIDAAWIGTNAVGGDTAQSDYTTAVWVTGVGKGATITPAGGNTGKTLFVPNAGIRWTDGNVTEYGTRGFFYCVTQSTTDTTPVWYLVFSSYDISGTSSYSYNKLSAYSLRCVRS